MDNLPAQIQCLCAKELSIPLAYLFNLSLKSGKVPDLWKSANITPIHKSDSRELVNKSTDQSDCYHYSKVFGADSAYYCLQAYFTLFN